MNKKILNAFKKGIILGVLFVLSISFIDLFTSFIVSFGYEMIINKTNEFRGWMLSLLGSVLFAEFYSTIKENCKQLFKNDWD